MRLTSPIGETICRLISPLHKWFESPMILQEGPNIALYIPLEGALYREARGFLGSPMRLRSTMGCPMAPPSWPCRPSPSSCRESAAFQPFPVPPLLVASFYKYMYIYTIHLYIYICYIYNRFILLTKVTLIKKSLLPQIQNFLNTYLPGANTPKLLNLLRLIRIRF